MSFQSRELVEVGPIKKMADFIGRPLQAKQQVVSYRSHISIPGICPTFPVFFFFFLLSLLLYQMDRLRQSWYIK